jgi:hypothetical protein
LRDIPMIAPTSPNTNPIRMQISSGGLIAIVKSSAIANPMLHPIIIFFIDLFQFHGYPPNTSLEPTAATLCFSSLGFMVAWLVSVRRGSVLGR